MALIIHRSIGSTNPRLYTARCILELHSSQRELLRKYGAAPLVRPVPGPVIAGLPESVALLTDNELTALIDSDGEGLERHSHDLREINRFVDDLQTMCDHLRVYWIQAAAFTGTSSFPFPFE